jgi:hypothetical protein
VRSFHDDAGLRQRVASANRQRAVAWSADAMTDRYVALYHRLAAAGVCGVQQPSGSNP